MAGRWSARRARFREIIQGTACVHPASVHDAISARIASDLGFEMGMFAGSVASLTVLGAPDLIVLTLSEFADQAYRISRGAELPLMVDADHGYGNALNVVRTVEELEAAGVAALTIEDTLLPRAFGAGEKPQLVPLAEGVGKMKAALAARSDPALAIVGRTSASSISNVDDAIARLSAYKAAGVDALMVPGINSRAELEKIAGAVDLPLIVGGSAPDLADPAYLASNRVRVWSAGHQAFAASVKAIHDTMKAAQEGAKLPGVADKDLMDWVTRAGEFSAHARNFLG